MTKAEVLACITVGGIIGSFAIALGIDYVVHLIPPGGAGLWVSLAVLLLIGTALLVTYRSYSRRPEADA
ncbi:hypothetical protein [Methanoculleus chikugoensis]|uniref:hypothetical protein n=1 Tax=Methanoculleus chikugoensis TaxID=118126 RepID=UPI000AEDD5C2|nr:hypothetical protein [Methanoculleus chikugoensis]